MDVDELPASTYVGAAATVGKLAPLITKAWGRGNAEAYSYAEIENGPRSGYVIFASEAWIEGEGLDRFELGKDAERASKWLLNLDRSKLHYPDPGRRSFARGWEIRFSTIDKYLVAICWAAYCPISTREKERIRSSFAPKPRSPRVISR